MQPLAGVQIASLIDAKRFSVTLHHEDWHGPFDPARSAGWNLVFLTGLQPDFDRMRQLSYYFRRAGSVVVAGGSVCTNFPEFAAGFFDVVCCGGVEATSAVVADYLAGRLRPIYRSPAGQQASFTVDYGHLARNGINPRVHLLEASRGCRFRCSFCVVPNEVGPGVAGDLAALARSLESAIRTSPWWSFRRLYPLILFYDNNFADDPTHARRVAAMLRADRRVRGWGALVTQNVLQNRSLVEELAAAKCRMLFVGLESLDAAMLRRYRKTQNLSRRSDVLDDISHAERLGITVNYGYLLDPRQQGVAEMRRQLVRLAEDARLPMPVYLSLVAPLAGTESFWEDLGTGRLAPGLMLRDLDGSTVAYTDLADDALEVSAFLREAFCHPWRLFGVRRLLAKMIRRLLWTRAFDPLRWLLIVATSCHYVRWSWRMPKTRRTFRPGQDALDPQYAECLPDISREDFERYFEPIRVTNSDGTAAAWLISYERARERGVPV